jgi:hypothetical protein
MALECGIQAPQFGQVPWSVPSAQRAQKVHSNEQILAPVDPGGSDTPQHSQLGLSCSMRAIIG